MDSKQTIVQQVIDDPYAYLRQIKEYIGLYDFMQLFWSEVSDDQFQPNWHIVKLCEVLEKTAERVSKNLPKENDIIINIPPGTTKTILCSIMYPAWCWSKWYWMRIIAGSYSDALSLEIADKCRDVIKSDKFKAIYPELGIVPGKDVKSNFRVFKRNQVFAGRVARMMYGGGRYSTSVGGTITGFHGHIIIIDDPLNPKQAASELELMNTNKWMDHTLSTRKTDKKVTPIILIMQRLHENDPTGHILSKKKERVKHICLPGEIENYKEQLQPKEFEKYYKDGLLDKKRMNWDVMVDLEADLGQYGFAAQIGQKPTPPGGGMFQVQHFQIIDRTISEVNIERTIRYWDKAGTDEKELKKGQDAKYTAGVKMSRMANGKYLVHSRIKGRWGTNERERIIKETAEADGKNVEIWIEQEPGSGGKDSAKATIRNLAGFHVEAECPSGDKVTRADPYSVQVNDGNVWLQSGDWNKDFIKEHEDFPFGKYKDQVDASAGAFNQLTSKRVAWISKRR